MESFKDLLLIIGLTFISAGITETFNISWWGFWLIVIIIIVAYTSIVIFIDQGGFQEYLETKNERKRKEFEKEQALKKYEQEEKLKIKRAEYEAEQKRIEEQKAFLNRTNNNPNVFQKIEDLNSTKNDCPNCGRSDGRHDPKCYV